MGFNKDSFDAIQAEMGKRRHSNGKKKKYLSRTEAANTGTIITTCRSFKEEDRHHPSPVFTTEFLLARIIVIFQFLWVF